MTFYVILVSVLAILTLYLLGIGSIPKSRVVPTPTAHTLLPYCCAWTLHRQASTFPLVEFLVSENLNQVVRLDHRVPARLRFRGDPPTPPVRLEASPGFLPQMADMPLTAVSLSSLPVISYSSFHHPAAPPSRPHIPPLRCIACQASEAPAPSRSRHLQRKFCLQKYFCRWKVGFGFFFFVITFRSFVCIFCC